MIKTVQGQAIPSNSVQVLASLILVFQQKQIIAELSVRLCKHKILLKHKWADVDDNLW